MSDRVYVIKAKTGQRVATRKGDTWLVLDLDETPKRVIERWFKRGYYFATAIYGTRAARSVLSIGA